MKLFRVLKAAAAAGGGASFSHNNNTAAAVAQLRRRNFCAKTITIINNNSPVEEDDFSELDMPVPEERCERDGVPKHSLNSSSVVEDDFSELDLPVAKEQSMHSNLVTEKPSKTLNFGLSRDASSGMHLRAKNASRIERLLPPEGSHCSVVENHSEVSITARDTEDSRRPVNSNSVIIENVPTNANLNQLRMAVSEFGEVLHASIRSEPGGFNTCDVEFKTLEAKERAVAAGGVIVMLKILPIRSLYTPDDITIRISNINMDTALSIIHSACISCGSVEGLSRINMSSVDVIFSGKDSSARENILEKLNALSAVNGWSAEIVTKPPGGDSGVVDITASDANQEQQEAVGLKLSRLLEDVQRQYQLKNVLCEDLVKLHQAVEHLQNRPT